MFLIHQCCQNEANDAYKCSSGRSWEYPYHSSLCTDDCEHGCETTYGSDFVKVKVRLNRLSWLKVTGVNCCAFVDSCHFCCVEYCAWYFVYFLGTMFW